MTLSFNIIRDLQEKCTDNTVSVAELLRSAKIASTRLGIVEIKKWIDDELNGYQCAADDLPEYRKIHGKLFAKDGFGNVQEVVLSNKETRDLFTYAPIWQGISTIESSVKKSNEQNGTLTYNSSGIKEEVLKFLGEDFIDCFIQVNNSRVLGLLDAVRNTIFDWSLKLEEEGLLSAIENWSPEQKGEVQEITKQVINNNFYGGVFNSNIVNGDQYVEFDSNKINELTKQIQDNISALPEETHEDILKATEDMRLQISSSTQDQSVIKSSLDVIYSVCKGVPANIVAAGIVKMIDSL